MAYTNPKTGQVYTDDDIAAINAANPQWSTMSADERRATGTYGQIQPGNGSIITESSVRTGHVPVPSDVLLGKRTEFGNSWSPQTSIDMGYKDPPGYAPPPDMTGQPVKPQPGDWPTDPGDLSKPQPGDWDDPGGPIYGPPEPGGPGPLPGPPPDDPGLQPPPPGQAGPPPPPGQAGPPPGGQYPGGQPYAPDAGPTPGATPPAFIAGEGPTGGTGFGGVGTVGAKAGPADYSGVQGFADQAYQQARRNIDPAQAQASRRMEQDLINKGIDPSSEQGMAMLDQQNRNFADQDNSANFGALQFGQGIQNQMFGQGLANAQQAGNMQQALWQNQTAQRSQDMQRYGMDQNFNLGSAQLDMNRQGQDFNQMLGLEGVDFRNRAYNDKQNQYYDQLTMAMMGIPIPGYGGYDPSGLAGQQMTSSGGGGIW